MNGLMCALGHTLTEPKHKTNNQYYIYIYSKLSMHEEGHLTHLIETYFLDIFWMYKLIITFCIGRI